MKDFTKGVLFVLCIAGVYKLGVHKGRKEQTEVIIETGKNQVKISKKFRKEGS